MGKDNKIHIILLGRRNTGKSSIINSVVGQNVSIVSDFAGTTTDPVKKSYEIPDFASVIFIDTAGIDDAGELGELRIKKTIDSINLADFAILVVSENNFGDEEKSIIRKLNDAKIPFFVLYNKIDKEVLYKNVKEDILNSSKTQLVEYSTISSNPEVIINQIKKVYSKSLEKKSSLLGDIVKPQDIVLLVAPIDSEAPTGRLILPQVQTIRDILDNKAVTIILQPGEIKSFFEKTKIKPSLVITDSQVFKEVSDLIDEDIPLTSFSIVLARQKGNFNTYIRGTGHIDKLKDNDKILMLESCSHHVSCEDIGRFKIPNLLKKYTGKNIKFDFVAGLDTIESPLSDYSMIIQCGGCMVTASQLSKRLKPAIELNIPVSNYGMTIAYVSGIFKRSVAIFE